MADDPYLGENDSSASDLAHKKTLVSVAALVGAVLGQLIFGVLADRIGRRVIFVVTISCVIVGAGLSSSVVPSEHFSPFYQLALWQFIMGFG